MAKRRRRSKKKSNPIVTIIVFILFIAGVIYTRTGPLVEEKGREVPPDSQLMVYFLDVGQGSSTLIQSGTSGVLIDAGETEYGDDVCSFIEEVGITKLEYVVATHPHSDHIGGLPQVLEKFGVGTVYAPELAERTVPTTRIYENFLDAVAQSGAQAKYAKVGDEFTFGGAYFRILGPVEQLDDLNNMSVIIRMVYGETEMMFVGDAENEEMQTLCDYGGNHNADVYLMGHHGSSTSIHKEFLARVSPSIAVISCGEGNSYGHPHREALEYIEKNNLTCLRTDTDGCITFTCTADGFTYETER